jgi:flavodoxin I
MATIGLFYGTTTENTANVADIIQDTFDESFPEAVEVINIADVDPEEMLEYEFLIVGSPTFDLGQLQEDWQDIYDELDDLDFTGKTVAVFGLGDQVGYPDHFVDVIGTLAEKFRKLGAKVVGYTDVDESYDFDESGGVENGQFKGLAIDEDNQQDLTDERVAKWVAQLIEAFGLS